MPNEIRWKATWTTTDGLLREFFFYSATSRAVARVDFLLKLMSQGQPIPDEYEVEEALPGLPTVPRRDAWREGSL